MAAECPAAFNRGALSSESSDDPLIAEDSSAADAAKPESPGLLWGGSAIAAASRVLAALGVAALIAVACSAALAHSGGWLVPGQPQQPLYINLVIDAARLPKCPTLANVSRLPCLMRERLLTGSRGRGAVDTDRRRVFPIGPMACWGDDGGLGDCKGSAFELVGNGTGVRIPETGVYRVRSRLTFYDSINYYVTATIRVSLANCSSLRCQSNDHAWLSCFNHSPSRGARSRSSSGAFTACTIDGVRHFDRGDVLSLQTSQAFRAISPYRKLTHLLVQRL